MRKKKQRGRQRKLKKWGNRKDAYCSKGAIGVFCLLWFIERSKRPIMDILIKKGLVSYVEKYQ